MKCRSYKMDLDFLIVFFSPFLSYVYALNLTTIEYTKTMLFSNIINTRSINKHEQPNPPPYCLPGAPPSHDLTSLPMPTPITYASPRNSISSASSSDSHFEIAESIYSSSSSIHEPIRTIDTELPSYSTGGDVQPITSDNHIPGILKIKIESAQPTYDIGNIIYGRVTFSPSKDVELASISVTLEGEESTIKSGWTAELLSKRHFNLAQHIVPVTALPPDLRAVPGFLYTFPFSVQIPEILPQEACTDAFPDHVRLPPSLGSSPEFSIPPNNLPGNVARIFYHLHACVNVSAITETQGLKSHHAYNFVHLIPSYSLSPNASLSTRKTSSHKARCFLKKGLLQTSKGSVELRLKDVPVIPKYSSSATNIPLRISFLPSKHDVTAPPPSIMSISIRMASRTRYMCGNSFTASQNLEDVNEVNTFMQRFFLERVLTANTSWELDMEIASQESLRAAYSAEIPLSISLPDSKLIVPTFESFYIARDYKLEVSVFLQDGLMLMVSAPVNVVSSLTPISNTPFDGVTDVLIESRSYGINPDQESSSAVNRRIKHVQ